MAPWPEPPTHAEKALPQAIEELAREINFPGANGYAETVWVVLAFWITVLSFLLR